MVDLFESAVETAWRVIEGFRGLVQDQIVLEFITALVRLYGWAEGIVEQPRYEELERKLEKLKDAIAQLAERIGTPIAQVLACEALHVLAGDLEADIQGPGPF